MLKYYQSKYNTFGLHQKRYDKKDIDGNNYNLIE